MPIAPYKGALTLANITEKNAGTNGLWEKMRIQPPWKNRPSLNKVVNFHRIIMTFDCIINFLELYSLCGAYTMDVIASTAFSVKIDSHNNPENQFVQMAKKAFNFQFDSPRTMLFCTYRVI